MSEPMPHVQFGNVILAVLVGFIVAWGLVYGLWRYWPVAVGLVGWQLYRGWKGSH